MKKFATALVLAAAIGLPSLAEAREITFTTKLKQYGGAGAYIALYVTDASFFPSIGAVNPTLTIIANALRVADRIKERLGA